MKKMFAIALLAISFAGCKKSTNIQESLEADSQSSKNKAVTSATVTTEAALKTAVANAAPGAIITISGTINLTSTLNITRSGTSSAKINLNGGTLNCSDIPAGNWGIKMLASYWNIQNMIIKSGRSHGLILSTTGCGYNYINNVTATGFQGTGIMIYSGAHHNTIANCRSNENYDPIDGGQNADGFACSLQGGAGNRFDRCVADHNSDDGFDLFGNSATVVLTNCTATRHGYGTAGNGNGFKLGSSGQNIPHTVTNCTSSYNKAYGYDGNGNQGHMTMTGSTGTGNGKGLFARIF
jgi:hypothetical protein